MDISCIITKRRFLQIFEGKFTKTTVLSRWEPLYTNTRRFWECIDSTYRSSQPCWPLTEGKQAPRLVFFKLAEDGCSKGYSPIISRRDRPPLLPKRLGTFFLSGSTLVLSILVVPTRGEGTMLMLETASVASCRIIRNTERHSSVFCFFLKPLSRWATCYGESEIHEAKLSCLTRPENRTKYLILNSRLSSKKY